jgi:hypothetical protein
VAICCCFPAAVRGESQPSTAINGTPTNVNYVEVDEMYRCAKTQQASDLFLLAKRRYADATTTNMPFIRYAAVFDAVSIAQSVNTAWMMLEQRQQFLEWYREATHELERLSQVVDVNEATNNHSNSLGNELLQMARVTATNARQQVLSMDLKVIQNAEPDGLIETNILDCEMMQAVLADTQGSVSEQELNATVQLLGKTIVAIKQRQQLRYTIWAERRFREATECDMRNVKPDEAKRMYIRLSEVNVALVAEPTLAQGIIEQLSVLYKTIPKERQKETRYDAIFLERKALADF